MNLFRDTGLAGFRDAIRQKMRAREAAEAVDPSVVEDVVDGADSRIRLVSGYRRKLHTVVQRALQYANDLVEQIPAPVEINRNSFVTDSHLNAYFVSYADLQEVFRRSYEIRQFLEDYSNADTPDCCALLCMHRSEKTVMGMDLSGDMLKKDVQQVAVSFSDYSLYAPAPSEAEARDGLRRCLFQGLVTHALEVIEQHRHENRRLQDRRNMFHSRLLHLQRSLEREPSSREVADGIDRTTRALASIDAALSDWPVVTPQYSLEQVIAVLSRPEQFVSLRKYPLRLDKMGIILDDDSGQPSNRLDLAEVTVGGKPHVVTLVKFSKDELLG